MVIAPNNEYNLFMGRDKFDIVAVCDESSKSFGSTSTPLSTLLRLISEQAFKRMLKRMPMLVVGGVEAWKKDFGESEVARGDGYHASSSFSSSTGTGGLNLHHLQEAEKATGSGVPLSSPKPMPSPKNPFVLNGYASPSLGSSSSTDVLSSPSLNNPFRNSSGAVNGIGSGGEHHKGSISLDQVPSHSRYVSLLFFPLRSRGIIDVLLLKGSCGK
jgi:ubiquitin carboxyl-terminal hydrolase 8